VRGRRALLLHTLGGVLTGALAGILVLAFRWIIEEGQRSFLPGGEIGAYEALPSWAVLALPLAGGLLLGLAFERLPPALRDVGIVHVLRRLRGGEPQQRLPPGNALVQLLAGTFAICCGHSVDREGPGVHLGAAVGDLLARRAPGLGDPETLVACGGAASIAAAFDTPLAGVIFVIEVLGVSYRVERFIPVVTAAVTGAIFSRLAYGAEPAFSLQGLRMSSLYDLPLLALLGLATGMLAAAFVSATGRFAHMGRRWRPIWAFSCAGLATGLIGQDYPQVLGVSYDTLNAILANELGAGLLGGLILGKLLATALSIGLRVPGGLIGPSLVLGGATGGLLGVVAPHWVSFATAPERFYAVVGMASMMAAVLKAPLAALLALLELTGNPEIIVPGMTALVTADLVARQWLGQESVFEHLIRLGGRGDPEPASRAADQD